MQSAFILILLVGLTGGVAVGLQMTLASLITQRLGTLESTFIVHLGGAVVAGIPLLFLTGGNLGQWRSLPWYAFSAGALGLVVIGAVTYCIPRLGVAPTIVLVVVGQLCIGVVLDHFGLLGLEVNPLTLSRVVGILVLFAGTWLVIR
jgi:bacterial/archaeal transporter family-2 protein